MDFTKDLLAAKADFKAGLIDVPTFTDRIAVVRDAILAAPEVEKATAFDTIVTAFFEPLIEPEEEYQPGILYLDSDSMHYTHEALAKAICGKRYYEFENDLYEGG
ncbi:MAG: hypothetical protein EOO77_29055 [Oxalobacteraceae bacterium]|nr:MAG: hypothetical protein EOO77_29055 [Oxalobacteraceae bacterium]